MKLVYKKGKHSPMVMGIQGVVGAEKDGFFGPNTESFIRVYQGNRGLDVDGIVGENTLAVMYKDGLSVTYRILEMIAYFEGAGWKANAWACTSEIGDGAGKNYGVMQMNKFGSMQYVIKHYMPEGENFADWIGTPDGAKAQYKYFLDQVLSRATSFALKIGDTNTRTIAMLCDGIVQGGGTYPSRPPRSYSDWELGDDEEERVKVLYEDYDVREAFLKSVRGHERPGRMFAELYPRSGNPKYLDDQLSRRRTAYLGAGRVHGTYYTLVKFGLVNNGGCDE